MARRQRKISEPKSIAVVCEGTETEGPYFRAIQEHVESKDGTAVIYVVPPQKNVQSKRKPKVNKELEPSKIEYKYYERYEKSESEYNSYCAEPTRWVREAYLLKNGLNKGEPSSQSYKEAWAVYDLDDEEKRTGHRKHEDAAKYAEQWGINIAFSSYSFEEWFLMHFERCRIPFTHSEYEECKECLKEDKDKKKKCSRCDKVDSVLTDKHLCVYLRVNDYIPDYRKNNAKNYFKNYTLQYFHKACVNSAWSRFINRGEFFKRNPYTSVDKLVLSLLKNVEQNYDIVWKNVNELFQYDGKHDLMLNYEDGTLYLQYLGDDRCLIGSDYIYWCDSNYQKESNACCQNNINFDNKDKCIVELAISNCSYVLCLKGIINTNMEYYFDVSSLINTASN